MILDRLHQYIKHKNLSFNKLEISIDASHGSISNAWKHGKNVRAQVIERILDTYSDISAEWLLRGKGEMIKSSNDHISNQLNDAENRLNEMLIEKCLLFFNCKDKKELVQLLNQPNKTLEETILNTWENKYGKELKGINHRLMTLFTSKLTSELEEKNAVKNSKIG